MRRAVVVILLLTFAGISETAALCLATPVSATIAAAHACCPDDTLSASQASCCRVAVPDRDINETGSYAPAAAPRVCTPHVVASDASSPTRAIASPVDVRSFASPPPLYLQHLSLLI